MRKAVFWAVGAVVLALGLDALGDLTQTRPDRPANGTSSEILLSVSTRSAEDPQHAAARLWAACQGTVTSRLVRSGPAPEEPSQWVAVTEPAVGPRSWLRLRGCLEDLTIDRIQARVMAKVDS